MQARWGRIIKPPLLKSLSTRADDLFSYIYLVAYLSSYHEKAFSTREGQMLEQSAPDELNNSVWAEN